ncbi:type II secretion system protein [Deltaproteobacteria bacterium TL4]
MFNQDRVSMFCSKYYAKSRRGFTLVELAISLGVLAILVGTIGPMGVSAISRKKGTDTYNQLQNVNGSLQRYFSDKGVLPSDNEGFSVLEAEGGSGPYISSHSTLDAWDRVFLYDRIDTLNLITDAKNNKVDYQIQKLAIIASKGVNNELDSAPSGGINGTWNLADIKDDIIIPSVILQTERNNKYSTVKNINAAMMLTASARMEELEAKYGFEVDGEKGEKQITFFNTLSSNNASKYDALHNVTATILKGKKDGEGNWYYMDPKTGEYKEEEIANVVKIANLKKERLKEKCSVASDPRECPIIFMEVYFNIQYPRDVWGERFLWDNDNARQNYEFYSKGPNRKDNKLADNSDDFTGRWY